MVAFVDRDVGTRFVVAGCVLGVGSLVLPSANFTEEVTLSPLVAGSRLGITWIGGLVVLSLLVGTLAGTYLVASPRVRAVGAGVVGLLVLIGAVYWWLRPDRSYPDRGLPADDAG